MPVTRPHFWLLATLIALYLAGVLFLSAITLHEPSSLAPSVSDTTKQQQNDANDDAIVRRTHALRRNRIQWCSTLKFQQPPADGAVVALASFPGSGNTWLRYLLQQATGILSGSVYKDYGLLKNGFPAESVSNASVLVVKTHEWGANARAPFRKAVLLVRAPAQAIQAEFNRQSGGHVGFASPDRYKRTKGKYWRQFVVQKLLAWRKTNMDWLQNFAGPTHVIFYEQLVANPAHTLRTILDFLDVRIDAKQFACALARQEGIYRRKRRVLNFDPYSDEMRRRISVEQQLVYDAIYNLAAPSR